MNKGKAKIQESFEKMIEVRERFDQDNKVIKAVEPQSEPKCNCGHCRYMKTQSKLCFCTHCIKQGVLETLTRNPLYHIAPSKGKEVTGEWILSCPLCLGGDFTIETKTIDATTCIICGTWLNELNDTWYLKDGTKLPPSNVGRRWICK